MPSSAPGFPLGAEDLIGIVEEDDLKRRFLEILRLHPAPAPLMASSRRTLLIAPRDERDRDVQRVVETHISEIAQAINRVR